MPIVQNVVRTGVQVAGAVRDLGRLREIMQILVAHGFGFLLDKISVPGLGNIRRRIRPELESLPLPTRATLAIQELGPTFIKLGQVLSTRQDLIPLNWCREFQTLQDNVLPVAPGPIMKQIEASLGAPASELFAEYSEEPLAAASIAQVHRAVLEDGSQVVLKVLRPGVVRSIRTDLDIVRFLARQLEKQVPELELLYLSGMIADFEKSILNEVDFTREAANTERFHRNLSSLEGVRVPKVYKEFSSKEVLCLEFFDGVQMRKARAAGYDMEAVGHAYFGAAARMLFEDGFFHGDLHPGNVLVLGDKLDEPILGLLDFGMAGTLTSEAQDNICAVLFATSRMDFRTVARVMFEVGVKTIRVNYVEFEGEVMELMQHHISGRSMGEIQIGIFLADLLQGCLRYRIQVPSGYTMLFKAIMTSEGLAKDLIPELDPLKEFAPVLEKVAKARFSRERLSQDLTTYLVSADYLLKRAPIIGSQMISDYETGQLRLPVLYQNTPAVERSADIRQNRVVLAVVLGALSLSAVWSMDKPQLLLAGVPVVTIILFALVGGLGGWLLLALLRTGGLSSGDLNDLN